MDNLTKNIQLYNRSLDQNIISEECKTLLSIIDNKNKIDELFASRKSYQEFIHDGINGNENKVSKGLDI